MSQHSIRLKEIAEKLGISIPSVSRALNNKADISEETKRKVQQAVKDLHYRKNLNAVNFKNQESRLIGVIIPSLHSSIFSNIVNGLVHQAEELGYHIVLLHSNASVISERKAVEMLQHKLIDGLIISLANSRKTKHLKELLKHDVPILMMNNVSSTLRVHKVVCDPSDLMIAAVKHLSKRGIKKIALFGCGHSPRDERLLYAYKRAHDAYLKTYNTLYNNLLSNTVESGYLAMRELIANRDIPAGIVCTSKKIAIGAIKALEEYSIQIPEQVAIIGIGDSDSFNVEKPGLPWVGIPAFEMGVKSVVLIKEEIELVKQKKRVMHRVHALEPIVHLNSSTDTNDAEHLL